MCVNPPGDGKYEVSQTKPCGSPHEWEPVEDPGACFRSLRRTSGRFLCCIFNETERERERGSNSFRFYNLAFLHAVKSSVRDDKLQFGERSSEILTRASSKPLYQLQNDIFISQWDGADSWKTKCLVAGRLACWLQEKMNIFLHRCQFVAKLPVSSDLRPDVTLQWRLLLLQLGVMVNFWWPVMPVYRYQGVFDIAV